jgi:hypothetical protein
MELKKFQKLIEAINTYYAFALLLYAAALFFTRHSQFLIWLALIATPLLAGWTGYILKGYLDRRNLYYGFKVQTRSLSYEINGKRHYVLRSNTKLKAASNHLMAYPILHQWSGDGKEDIPKLHVPGQHLLGVVRDEGSDNGSSPAAPYTLDTPSQGDWRVWFVGLNPPAQKGDEIEVRYSQEFIDRRESAKPYLYYVVSVPMDKLELSVKFPKELLPKSVTGRFYKPSEPRMPHKSREGAVNYDADKQWATWVIDNPKRGYCYRIDWQ